MHPEKVSFNPACIKGDNFSNVVICKMASATANFGTGNMYRVKPYVITAVDSVPNINMYKVKRISKDDFGMQPVRFRLSFV